MDNFEEDDDKDDNVAEDEVDDHDVAEDEVEDDDVEYDDAKGKEEDDDGDDDNDDDDDVEEEEEVDDVEENGFDREAHCASPRSRNAHHMSQEPLYSAEIYRRNAAAQNRDSQDTLFTVRGKICNGKTFWVDIGGYLNMGY